MQDRTPITPTSFLSISVKPKAEQRRPADDDISF
jgi:hypothetical protein